MMHVTDFIFLYIFKVVLPFWPTFDQWKISDSSRVARSLSQLAQTWQTLVAFPFYLFFFNIIFYATLFIEVLFNFFFFLNKFKRPLLLSLWLRQLRNRPTSFFHFLSFSRLLSIWSLESTSFINFRLWILLRQSLPLNYTCKLYIVRHNNLFIINIILHY